MAKRDTASATSSTNSTFISILSLTESPFPPTRVLSCVSLVVLRQGCILCEALIIYLYRRRGAGGGGRRHRRANCRRWWSSSADLVQQLYLYKIDFQRARYSLVEPHMDTTRYEASFFFAEERSKKAFIWACFCFVFLFIGEEADLLSPRALFRLLWAFLRWTPLPCARSMVLALFVTERTCEIWHAGRTFWKRKTFWCTVDGVSRFKKINKKFVPHHWKVTLSREVLSGFDFISQKKKRYKMPHGSNTDSNNNNNKKNYRCDWVIRLSVVSFLFPRGQNCTKTGTGMI